MDEIIYQYNRDADTLVVTYKSRPFKAIHQQVLALVPKPPAMILDVGAGTSRNAA